MLHKLNYSRNNNKKKQKKEIGVLHAMEDWVKLSLLPRLNFVYYGVPKGVFGTQFWLFSVPFVLAAAFPFDRYVVRRLRKVGSTFGETGLTVYRVGCFVLLFLIVNLASSVVNFIDKEELTWYDGPSLSEKPYALESATILWWFMVLKMFEVFWNRIFTPRVDSARDFMGIVVWSISLRFEDSGKVLFLALLELCQCAIMLVPNASGMHSFHRYARMGVLCVRYLEVIFTSFCVNDSGCYFPPLFLLRAWLWDPLVVSLSFVMPWKALSLFWIIWTAYAVIPRILAEPPEMSDEEWLRKRAKKHYPSFSEEELNELVKVFCTLDINKNHRIDATELAVAIDSFDKEWKLNVEKARAYIKEVDKDSSGDLDWLEFLDIVHRLKEDGDESSNLARIVKRSGILSFLQRENVVDSGSLSSSEEVLLCFVCLQNERNVVLKPCYHLALCKSCDDLMRKHKTRLCPVCSKVVTSSKQAYY